MSLNEQYDEKIWPATHYVFIEKIGPFHETAPQAWGELHQNLPAIAGQSSVTSYFSQYKPELNIYRAGVGVAEKPDNLPNGIEYAFIEGGKYFRFVVTGSYAQLGEATARVLEIAASGIFKVSDSFYLENYLNDPRVTPEEELITEILAPAT